ncbi:hypothetical protein MXD62_19310 [Frankia sp. Mgl5]|uniref:hypothetical protein n=1 Tax=Frankia sp. Mgl5 TaxID=2933793 RepID=UPI00200D4614|nr:hypothetical protein [Frankia sp. Mgl5]MCK9929300.1 hypothetical protein [Frankia sp. Mgl5]
MRILSHLTHTRPPTTLTCIAALGIARSGGAPMLLVRIGIAVLFVAVAQVPYMDVQAPTAAVTVAR